MVAQRRMILARVRAILIYRRRRPLRGVQNAIPEENKKNIKRPLTYGRRNAKLYAISSNDRFSDRVSGPRENRAQRKLTWSCLREVNRLLRSGRVAVPQGDNKRKKQR